MPPRLPSLLSPISTLVPLLLCTFLCSPSFAQWYTPSNTTSPYFSFIDGQALYIGGGSLRNSITPQNFAIDFTVSWKASSPAYIPLQVGISTNVQASTISADGRQWIVGDAESISVYDIESNSWGIILSYKSGDLLGDAAATDPETGLVYMPSSNWIAPNEASLLKVNLTSRTYTKDKLPAALSAVESPKIAWSAAGKKMFYLGGKDLVNGGFGFFAYTFNAKDGWKDISKVMKGQAPSPRVLGCIAPAYGGTKIIAFAGYGDVTTLSDIYILDVATTTWTKGANAPASEARTSTACGVSGDYFVSWSGSSDGSDFGDKFPSTVIYNIKTNQWTDSFVGSGNAPKATTQRPTSSSVPSSETPLSNKTSSNSPSVSVILLPILGIVILGLGVGIFIRYRSHRSPVEEKKNNAHYEEQTEDHSRGRNPHHSQIDSPATLSTSIVYDGSGASGERVQRNPHYSPQHPTYVAQEYNYHSSVPAYYQDSPISYPSHTLENWPQRGAFVAGRPMEEEKVSQHPHALVMDQESADYVPYSCAVPDKTSSDGDDSYVRPNMVYTGQFQDPSVNKS